MSPNKYLIDKIVSLFDMSVATSPTLGSCTKLDSHDNMVVLGKNCFVFNIIHGQTCDVGPFNYSIGIEKKVPIVYADVS